MSYYFLIIFLTGFRSLNDIICTFLRFFFHRHLKNDSIKGSVVKQMSL
jgi:hypothetical protein